MQLKMQTQSTLQCLAIHLEALHAAQSQTPYVLYKAVIEREN